MKRRILIVTDKPIKISEELDNYEIFTISPNDFKTINYPKSLEDDIRYSYNVESKLSKMISGYDPQFIHIALEGPLGLATRKYCIKNKLNFTTNLRSDLPKYMWKSFLIPSFVTYLYLYWFNKKSSAKIGWEIATSPFIKNLVPIK